MTSLMQKLPTFFRQKNSVFTDFMFEKFNVSLPNNVVSFEQWGPDKRPNYMTQIRAKRKMIFVGPAIGMA